MLWRVLEGLPQNYRQPMVLFYRQQESVARVAEILGVSEEVVRQRLSRGRAMLHERVPAVVERGLRRLGPTKAFALSQVLVPTNPPAASAARPARQNALPALPGQSRSAPGTSLCFINNVTLGPEPY